MKHKIKIKSIGKLTDNEFLELYNLILRNITLLNQSLIPTGIYKNAELMCQDIDIDDTIFVAVSEFTKGTLWTGDLKLINGLNQKGFNRLIKTDDLYQDFILQEKSK